MVLPQNKSDWLIFQMTYDDLENKVKSWLIHLRGKKNKRGHSYIKHPAIKITWKRDYSLICDKYLITHIRDYGNVGYGV